MPQVPRAATQHLGQASVVQNSPDRVPRDVQVRRLSPKSALRGRSPLRTSELFWGQRRFRPSLCVHLIHEQQRRHCDGQHAELMRLEGFAGSRKQYIRLIRGEALNSVCFWQLNVQALHEGVCPVLAPRPDSLCHTDSQPSFKIRAAGALHSSSPIRIACG